MAVNFTEPNTARYSGDEKVIPKTYVHSD